MELFDDKAPEDSSNYDLGYYGFIRLAFLIDTEKLRYSCKTSPDDTDYLLMSKTKIEQVIEGYSEPINNQELLPKVVFERQNFANQIFDSKSLYIYFKEEKKDERFPHLRPHHLSTRTDKNKKSFTTVYWKIDDRSLFTRLLNIKSQKSLMKCTAILSQNDFDFRKEIEKENKIPDHISINGLFLTDR